MAKNEKAVKAPKAPKGDGPSARQAYLEKRMAGLKALKAKDEQAFLRRVNFKEAMELKLVDATGKLIAEWKQFCAAKAAWDLAYWKAAAEKGLKSGGTGKSAERKKAVYQKLLERMKKYQDELKALGIEPDAKSE